MKLIVHPCQSLSGQLTLPGDKSLSHRAALFSALAEGTSQIGSFQVSGVTRRMLAALQDLGVAWELQGDILTVTGKGWQAWKAPERSLQCGNSATTLRLLSGALAGSGLPAVLDGSDGLRRRPMGRIVKPLQQMGVVFEGGDPGHAPLTLAGRPSWHSLHGIDYRLPVASAQVKSCLLLAGLAAAEPLILHEPGPSRDHTERMLTAMGVEIDSQADPSGKGNRITLQPHPGPLHPLTVELPGDLSSAAFLIAAALTVPEAELTLCRIDLNPTRTGFLDALQSMGADLQIKVKGSQAGEPFGDIWVRSSRLHGIEVSGDLVVRMIDEFPAFAAVALRAEGVTVVREATELRHKESDRIACLCQEFSSLGVSIQETRDGFVIPGSTRPRGGFVHSHGDHRLAMALAVAGLGANEPVRIQNADIIQESFPEFPNILTRLGADLQMETEA